MHTLPINILLGSFPFFLLPQMQFPNGYFCTVLQLALSQPGQAIKLRPTKTGPPHPHPPFLLHSSKYSGIPVNLCTVKLPLVGSLFFLHKSPYLVQVQDFWFADYFKILLIFSKSTGCCRFSSGFLVVLNQNLNQKLPSKAYLYHWMVSCDQRNTWTRPYGFKNLFPSKKPATVTRQLKKSVDFCQNYHRDFHLSIQKCHKLIYNCPTLSGSVWWVSLRRAP